MKITKLSAYQIDVPIKPATISHGRVMSVFDETVVRIETDAGIDGWGCMRRRRAEAQYLLLSQHRSRSLAEWRRTAKPPFLASGSSLERRARRRAGLCGDAGGDRGDCGDRPAARGRATVSRGARPISANLFAGAMIQSASILEIGCREATSDDDSGNSVVFVRHSNQQYAEFGPCDGTLESKLAPMGSRPPAARVAPPLAWETG